MNSIDFDNLRRIEAIMYSGRPNQESARDEKLNLPAQSKEDVVRTIVEKCRNLDVYFDRGLDRARSEGLDLDSF